MSSRDKRLCPGVDGRKCGAYMSPVVKNPHPTCTRCRGRNCTGDSTCNSCKDWSLVHWDAFNTKRSHTDRLCEFGVIWIKDDGAFTITNKQNVCLSVCLFVLNDLC